MGILLCLLSATVQANVVTTPHVRAQLLSENQSIEAGQPFWVALHFSIIDGWHTYWRNAGDSGNAPTLKWSLPPGFSASDIHWPYPKRLPIGPLMNYGYEKQAWMLVQITPPATLPSGTEVSLRARADWLVCEEECIPEHGELQLSLPVAASGQSQASGHAADFAAVRQRLPQSLPWPAVVGLSEGTLQLSIATGALDASRLEDVYFFGDTYGIVEHAAPQTFRLIDDRLVLELQRGELQRPASAPLSGVLLLSESSADGTLTRAFSVTATPVAPAVAMHFMLALAFALAGGVLLNIMPCVFPILSMKALAIVQTAQQAQAQVRRNGIAFTAGVLLSFFIIAGVLLALRASGEAIGWGFQLQSPLFILLLTWLIFAMGLMLSGIWSFGEGWLGVGQQLTTRHGMRGSFFTGVLAVIVATPCTAPFMGTALGYALTQPAWQALAVFALLGLGMALPWLAISFIPAVSRALPKPGAWMDTVKQLLAFPLYATSAWLLWVFAQQTTGQALLFALSSLVVLALGLWLWQQGRTRKAHWRRLSISAAALCLASLLASLYFVTPRSDSPTKTTADEHYTPARLTALREQGQPVFLNLTAAWCITCLVNEKVALSTQEVQDAFEAQGIVYLKGDWTNRDPAITDILERHGRSGVPLYLLFPANQQQAALVLPNILTPGIVLAYLAKIR